MSLSCKIFGFNFYEINVRVKVQIEIQMEIQINILKIKNLVLKRLFIFREKSLFSNAFGRKR